MSEPIHIPSDPQASPFKLLIDPAIRERLRKALIELMDHYDQELEKYAAEGFLELDTTKEYIELLCHHLRDTMSTQEGVAYLLGACGCVVPAAEIDLNPRARWKVQQ